jgi:hypothetical protein
LASEKYRERGISIIAFLTLTFSIFRISSVRKKYYFMENAAGMTLSWLGK